MNKLKYILALIFGLILHSSFAQEDGQSSASPESGQVLDKIVAKVNNYIVLESDVQKAYLDAISQSRQGFETPSRCDVFESLLINKLMVAKADLDSVMVSDAEVMIQTDQRFSMILAQLGGDESVLPEIYGKTAD
ncbi:SurA N-terminal domain-containing protein, partial [Cecembia sp.]